MHWGHIDFYTNISNTTKVIHYCEYLLPATIMMTCTVNKLDHDQIRHIVHTWF